MHIPNTGSPVAAVSPIDVKRPDALDDSKLVLFPLHLFNADPIVAVFRLVGISAYFISEQNIFSMT